MNVSTTRERIDAMLRDDAFTVSTLSEEFELSRRDVVSHLRHVAKSVQGEGSEFLVRPPECLDCGFDDFDDLLNEPSRCPECKSESIREPAFRIREPAG
ncbi:MAG: transcriptional regulator [Halodesulfurarchaeum sp.]